MIVNSTLNSPECLFSLFSLFSHGLIDLPAKNLRAT